MLRPFVDERFVDHKYTTDCRRSNTNLYLELQNYFYDRRNEILERFPQGSLRVRCNDFLSFDKLALRRVPEIHSYIENRYSRNRQSIYKYVLQCVGERVSHDMYVYNYVQAKTKTAPTQGK